MKLFDTQLYADTRPEVDFANMAFFGVERALLCAHAPGDIQTAEDLWQHFERLVVVEPARLARHGVEASVALGVHPRAVPQRAHDELWRELPMLLQDRRVAALGQLSLVTGGPDEWRLIERQLALVARHAPRLPIIFALPTVDWDTRQRIGAIERLALATAAAGLDTADLLIQHVDLLTIDAVEAVGATSGLSIHPFYLDVETATRVALHHDRRRMVVGSALRAGPADILALPRLAVSLSQAGLPPEEVARVLYGNAMALLVRPRP